MMLGAAALAPAWLSEQALGPATWSLGRFLLRCTNDACQGGCRSWLLRGFSPPGAGCSRGEMGGGCPRQACMHNSRGAGNTQSGSKRMSRRQCLAEATMGQLITWGDSKAYMLMLMCLCLQVGKDMEQAPGMVDFEDAAYVKGAADKTQSSVGARMTSCSL